MGQRSWRRRASRNFKSSAQAGGNHALSLRMCGRPGKGQVLSPPHLLKWGRWGSRVCCRRDRRYIVRLALWCQMLLKPAGKGAGHTFRVSLSHQFSWGFLVVLSSEDFTRGPGVVGGFCHSTRRLFSTTACVPRLQ